MRSVLPVVAFAVCASVLAPGLVAQACNDAAVRGTYCLTCTGWMDLSKLVPGAPAGFVPTAFVGVNKTDGVGRFSGWLVGNAGGVKLTLEFVDST
ncbi:MAG: hypothetical protein AAB225_30275, partial [Acidobacteriota bacterium]